MPLIRLSDYQDKVLEFEGVQILELESAGHSHEEAEYKAIFTLFKMEQVNRGIVISVDLPANKNLNTVYFQKHLLISKGLDEAFEQLDKLDMLQHVRLPYWVGSCAMLDHDIQGRRHIRVSLRRGSVEFMDQCNKLGHRVEYG